MLREAAFRQELVLIVFSLTVLGFLKNVVACINVLPWGFLVLITESLNTGIEKAVDLCTTEWKELAKQSKDVSSLACGLAITSFVFVCFKELFL